MHPNDRRRVVRALELAEAGSSLAGDALWSGDTRRPTLVFGLEVPDDVLEQRIRERADAMLERGVVEEARAALARPLSRSARKIMGLVDFAELPPEEARDALVANNRRLARYQRKWMRRIPGLIAVDGEPAADEIADDILGIARSRGMLAVVIKQATADDWELLREVRLRALADSPEAFLETTSERVDVSGEPLARARVAERHAGVLPARGGAGMVSCFVAGRS